MIGHYGSGKSHFLGFVAQKLQSGGGGGAGPTRGTGRFSDGPRPIVLSLLNYPASMRLEDAISSAAGIEAKQDDRRLAWSELSRRHPRGILLLIDELSEFLRSKPDKQSFNEDVRFLQFLGEFAESSPMFILCAMQEQIEHTGDLEVSLYRKIKDRFRIRFQLTPAHVAELIADSILVKLPAYRGAVAEIIGELARAFPGLANLDLLASIYPIHPATLDLLEEIRGQFSQTRGIVDFVLTQLAGSETRRISPFLDRPLGELLAPDTIVDHFRDLLELQPEFVALAERVLPYYSRHGDELFETEAQRQLARRLLNLLILVHLSPQRTDLAPDEAAHWLLFKGTRIAPAKNVEIVRRVLDQLTERGRYVKKSDGRYALDLTNDGRQSLDVLLSREVAELGQVGAAAIHEALALLPDGAFHPLALAQETWIERPVTWHFHERTVAVWIGDDQPTARSSPAIVIRTPWGSRQAAPGLDTLIPDPIEVGPDVLELVAMKRLSQRPLAKEMKGRLDRRISERGLSFERQLRAAYRGARIAGSTGGEIAPPPLEGGLHSWLDDLSRIALRRTYPSFERFAPTHGPLPQEAHRRFMAFAKKNDLGAPADEMVDLIREAYLLPLKLLAREGKSHAVAKRLDRHELVQVVTTLAAHNPSPKALYDQLSTPVYGLVPDQIQVLLGLLVVQGAIDILKGSRSYRDSFETLVSPLKYDRVVLSSALSLEETRSLERLADSLGLKKPVDSTVFAQRRAAIELRHRANVVHGELVRMRAMEIELGEELADRIDRTLERLGVLLAGDDELAALSRLVADPRAIADLGQNIVELRDLPSKIRRFQLEVSRLVHLARHPDLEEIEVAAELRRIEDPPRFGDADGVERWIERARRAHQSFADAYRSLHDDFWAQRAADPAFVHRPHPLAESRHVGISELLEELERERSEAERSRCRRLSDLEHEPVCRCGFDRRTAPIDRALAKFAEIRRRIDDNLSAFFADETVRARLASWEEKDEATTRYLAREAALPGISDVAAFDRHLSGIESLKELELGPLIALLTEKTWRVDELESAFLRYLSAQETPRLRFRAPAEIDGGEIAAWCFERSLLHAVPLPRALTHARAPIRPEWISTAALHSLARLSLPDSITEEICRWILDGTIALPDPARADSPVVRAAVDLASPSAPSTVPEYAVLMRDLARAHPTMMRIAEKRWLLHLDRRANAELTVEVPPLEQALARHVDAQWIVVDALGLLAAEAIEGTLPGWKLESEGYARTGAVTTTDAFNRMLLQAGIEHSFARIDAVDRIIHERALPLDDLVHIARAEIAAEVSRVRLDRSRAVLVFADHGFRRGKDGRRWIHGGASTLERLVPMFRFV